MRSAVTVFVALFLAELGDKTQLAVISFVAGGQSRWPVFFGAAAALVISSALAVLAGDALLRVVPPAGLQLGAAVLFLVVGLFVGSEALRELRG